jgi:hypothetical protein
MPFITETQLARINSTVAGAQNKLAKAKERAEQKAGEIKDGMEIVGAATLMNYVRGMMESKGNSFVIPGTQVDIELVAGVGLVGLGMADVLGEYDNDALMLGYGCLAHYMGQLARGYGKSGSFSMVAGVGADPLSALLAGNI